MSTAIVDAKRRVVLPSGKPGEVYDIQREDDGRLLLVRLARPEPTGQFTKESALEAMRKAPLRPTVSWEELKQLTRDP